VTSGYGGDAALARLLRAEHAGVSVTDVRALVAGVLAAAEGHDPAAWTRLVVPEPSAALRDQLLALKDVMAEPARPDHDATAARLDALRAELARRGLDGFLVPVADEHQGEYFPARARRLAWLTGFTGSAGVAVVLADAAAIFVDGRYTLQAEAQVDGAAFERHHLTDDPPETWIGARLGRGRTLGYDPWLHTKAEVDRLAKAAAKAGGRLAPATPNPLDAVWTDQPPPPLAPVVAHDETFTGRLGADKRAEVAQAIACAGAGAAVLTDPASLAWLLNLRGGDVPNAPLPLGFAIVHADGRVDLFTDPRKLAPEARQHLGAEVTVRRPDALAATLAEAARAAPVLADPKTMAAWLFDRVAEAGGTIVEAPDPCALPRARKNAVEIAGTRAAHRRDGAALSRFLAWLAAEAPKGGLTEMDAAAKLYDMRKGGEHYRGPSFETIPGAGPNGAIVHYHPTPATNRLIEPGSLFLVDSGGQYLDGTTDVTRTIAIGTPDDAMRRAFTAVLKGHIALARARFPAGTSGSQLDAFARRPLWDLGLDYDHGTGHGVGSFLGVHEGPQRISKVPNTVALDPGMIVSNEPGYYQTGAFGIRIENLVVVIEDGVGATGRPMRAFETLTHAPIDRALVDAAMLDATEARWLDDYHRAVRAIVAPQLDGAALAWLERATRPIAEGP